MARSGVALVLCLSRGKAVRYALKTVLKVRVNPNCRVIQIVASFVVVGAVLAPCRSCDGTEQSVPTTDRLIRRVVAPECR